MTFVAIRLGRMVAQIKADIFDDRNAVVEQFEQWLKEQGISYDRIEPWNPCKIFTGKVRL